MTPHHDQQKGTTKLKRQIEQTKERMGDAEFAMEHGDLSQGRRRELQIKNEHRREDIQKKKEELSDMTEE